jgi:dUTP pyrophosphatase
MIVKIKSTGGYLPKYETIHSAGMDINAYLNEPLSLKPMERVLVPTGLFIELESGYEAQIRARSGLAIKHGIGLVNGVGTIDSDYRGEIKILLINWGEKDFIINNGDRIAQIVFAKYERINWEIVDEVEDTKRGSGGFGHTGEGGKPCF